MKKRWFLPATSLLIIGAVYLPQLIWSEPKPVETSLSQVQQMVEQRNVQSVTLYQEESLLVAETARGKFEARFLPEASENLVSELTAAKVPYTVKETQRGLFGKIFSALLSMLPLLLFAALFLLAPRLMGRGMSGSLMGRSNYSAHTPKERLKDVIGAEEAIATLRVLLNFLKNPERFKKVKLERGVLLHGPTGTGKTLLSKALAGEAGVPFYHLSGSNLTSMFGNGTTQRILSFFERVKKEVAADKRVIVFIDEIDGLASKRRDGSSWADDRSGAVTALLHQVSDLLDSRPYAILIAATNHIDRLDEAVTRSQRLGLHIHMPNPDAKARKMILELNGEGLAFKSDIDLGHVAKLTTGMSGADIASIPGRASVLAVQDSNEDDDDVTQGHLEQAAMELAVGGALRHSAVVTPEDARVSEVHESGHAVVAQASPYHSLLVVTTIPVRESGGSTWFSQIDRALMTREMLNWWLAVRLAGREAELLDLGETSSGPSHDIQSATQLALRAVCEWGLFDEFLMNVDPKRWEDHPDSSQLNQLVKTLINEGRDLARKVLDENEAFRHRLQAELAKKRILHSDELKLIAVEYDAEAAVPAQV